MAYRIIIRQDTASNWATVNPILAQGEVGYANDSGVLKFGNGAAAWNSLPAFSSGSSGGINNHGELAGLGDDDHAQYHNDARGDARYYIKSLVDAALAAKYDASNPSGYVTAASAASSAPVQSVAGKTGAVTLTKADTGLANVDDTSDANKPVSIATQAALDGKQPLAPVLTNTTASFTTALESKLAGIEAGADVTDAANVNAAGAVMNSDYTPSHSILVQQSGAGAPTAVPVGNSTIVGRLAGGGSDIAALSAGDVRTLINVANGATANSTDAVLLARANHTGTQAISTITGLQTALDEKVVKDRVTSAADGATITPNIATTEVLDAAALSADFTIANPTGTPRDWQPLTIVVTTAAAQAITHGDAYIGSTTSPLPTVTSGAGKTDILGYRYSARLAKWLFVATSASY